MMKSKLEDITFRSSDSPAKWAVQMQHMCELYARIPEKRRGVTVYLFSASFIFRPYHATIRSCPSSSSCFKHAPTPHVLAASVATMKRLVGSGKARTGPVVKQLSRSRTANLLGWRVCQNPPPT